MFQGPRQDILPYFESLRYVKPKHFSTSAFLSEVTTPEGACYLQPGFPRLEREDFIASFLLSPVFRDICRVVNCADSTQEQIWVQGRRPLELKFAESGSTLQASLLVGEVVEKGGTLGEASMDHTSSVSPGDEIVAVGGTGGLLKYFKTSNSRDNSSSQEKLAEAIDEVAEPIRLQLRRHFDPVKIHNVRKIVEDILKKKFEDFKLTFSIGGQIRCDGSWEINSCNILNPWDNCSNDPFTKIGLSNRTVLCDHRCFLGDGTRHSACSLLRMNIQRSTSLGTNLPGVRTISNRNGCIYLGPS